MDAESLGKLRLLKVALEEGLLSPEEHAEQKRRFLDGLNNVTIIFPPPPSQAPTPAAAAAAAATTTAAATKIEADDVVCIDSGIDEDDEERRRPPSKRFKQAPHRSSVMGTPPHTPAKNTEQHREGKQQTRRTVDVTRVVLGDPAREPLTVPAELHAKLKQGFSINQKVDVLCDGVSETKASVRVRGGGNHQPWPWRTLSLG